MDDIDEVIQMITSEAEETFNVYWTKIFIKDEPVQSHKPFPMTDEIDATMLRITRKAFVAGYQAALIRMLRGRA